MIYRKNLKNTRKKPCQYRPVLEFMNTSGDGSMEVLNIAIPDVYVEHGNVELLRKETGIDADGIIGKIIDRKAQ